MTVENLNEVPDILNQNKPSKSDQHIRTISYINMNIST